MKARFEAYLEATVEKRMFVRDVPIVCKARDRIAGSRYRHVRCTARNPPLAEHAPTLRVCHESGEIIGCLAEPCAWGTGARPSRRASRHIGYPMSPESSHRRGMA